MTEQYELGIAWNWELRGTTGGGDEAREEGGGRPEGNPTEISGKGGVPASGAGKDGEHDSRGDERFLLSLFGASMKYWPKKKREALEASSASSSARRLLDRLWRKTLVQKAFKRWWALMHTNKYNI